MCNSAFWRKQKSSFISVFVLPPFLSKYRYLAHKVVDEYFFPSLCSFSIGQEEKRRIVIGWTSVILRCCLPYRCVHEKLAGLFLVEKSNSCICIEKLKSLNLFPSTSSLHVRKKRAVMKDMKAERGKTSVATLEMKHTGGNQATLKERQKRPDKQLYVPRALRGLENKTVSLNEKVTGNLDQKSSKKPSPQCSKKGTSSTSSSSSVASVSSSKVILQNNCTNKCENLEEIGDSTTIITSSCSEDVKKNCTSQNTFTHSVSSVPSESVDQINFRQSNSSANPQTLALYNNFNENYGLPNSTNSIISEKVSECEKECCTIEDFSINSVESSKEDETKCFVLSVADDSVDFKNREHDHANVLDTCSTSDIESLNISDKSLKRDDYLQAFEHSNMLDKSLAVEENLQATTSSNLLPEEREDSWESMFNDDGECLNSDFVKELTSVTGQIKVCPSKSDYSEYQPIADNVPEEYENIVELYNFPKEFSTQDLVSALSLFQQSSYCIKWVDDCHALAVFTSPSIANQALQINHPFVKVRPLSEGIKESKTKARWCASHSEPAKPRPVTSAALARRLVSGALGLKVQATKEQRELERNMLKNAREKRKQKAKQREDIWNGVAD
ncbi:coiled-coil domain-containing protein R3HCC1L [Nephila pilipes]|uniref:Coiled-coil domain-containing protein R3HCC1L n=1 Tax=Nephila pilipes TaxID=299642 RepID=A0A8X6IAI1_NEPPI|nr:coiled-coil domain-containing protein R3HCC1L [Nephila pilipes]